MTQARGPSIGSRTRVVKASEILHCSKTSLLIFYDNHFKKKIRYIFQRSTMEINIYNILKKKSKIFSLTLHFIYSKILQIKTRTDFLLRFIMESLAPFILSFQNTCQHFLTLSSWYFYVFCNGAIYRSVVWVHV